MMGASSEGRGEVIGRTSDDERALGIYREFVYPDVVPAATSLAKNSRSVVGDARLATDEDAGGR